MTISPELLSKVLDVDCDHIGETHGNTLGFNVGGVDVGRINIYELANRSKVWSLTLGYNLVSAEHSRTTHAYCGVFDVHVSKNFIEIHNISTEVQAVINGAEWVLQNGEKK